MHVKTIFLYFLQLVKISSARLDNTIKDGENAFSFHLSEPVFEILPEQDSSNELFTSIIKRNARTKCGMAAYLHSFGPGKSKSKRDLNSSSEIKGRDHGELVDRTMTLPGNDMAEFFDGELVSDSFIPIVWDNSSDPDEEEGFCTALCEKIGTAQAKSFAVQHISGCTVLIIASRTAVYIGHYWENIVFSPDDDFLEGTTAEELFNDYVIQGLKVGVKNPPGTSKYTRQRQTALQDCRSLLLPNDNAAQHLKAYLFRPISSYDEEPQTYAGYKEKWVRMRKTIGEILPELASVDGETINPKWTDFTYTPLDNDNEGLDDTAAGKLVFKYDPDHNGQKKAALWIEDDSTDRHNDQWT